MSTAQHYEDCNTGIMALSVENTSLWGFVRRAKNSLGKTAVLLFVSLFLSISKGCLCEMKGKRVC